MLIHCLSSCICVNSTVCKTQHILNFSQGYLLKTKIGRHFTFEAAHQLNGAQYGKCQQMHGHRYELTIEIEGEVNQNGWICDFAELDSEVQTHILNRFDHQNLNDHLKVPTVENIALLIFHELDTALRNKSYSVTRVVLYETHDSYAEIAR